RLDLQRLRERAGAETASSKQVGRSFRAGGVEQPNDRVEQWRRGGGRLDLDGDVGGHIQAEARALRFAGAREGPFGDAGELESTGAVRLDRFLVFGPAASSGQLVETTRGKRTEIAALIPAIGRLRRRSRRLARKDPELIAVVRSPAAGERLDPYEIPAGAREPVNESGVRGPARHPYRLVVPGDPVETLRIEPAPGRRADR